MTILAGGPQVLPELGPAAPKALGKEHALEGLELLSTKEMRHRGWVREERIAYYAGYSAGAIERATAESRAKRKQPTDTTIWSLT